MLRNSLTAMKSNRRRDGLCVRLRHRRDLDAFERSQEDGAASISSGKFCCLGLFIECGKFGSKGFSARFDGRQVDRFREGTGHCWLRGGWWYETSTMSEPLGDC